MSNFNKNSEDRKTETEAEQTGVANYIDHIEEDINPDTADTLDGDLY